jgi:hypothetical protein
VTFRKAAYLVASDEVARAKDWEYTLWANPKVPRSAVKKAKLEVRAAQLRAARILSTPVRHLPTALRIAVERRASAAR